jgi:predicted ATPase/DNA-binding SARP family transcriptional activator/Tfp pilus assembly protein PilF
MLKIFRQKNVKYLAGCGVLLSSYLSVKCFGGLVLNLDGRPLTGFETDKSKALLIYLAIESERELTRRQLASLLWPDDSEDCALHNLRQTLSSLRKTFIKASASVEVILADRNNIRINPDVQIWVDCLAFKTEMQRALSYYQNHARNGFIHVLILERCMDLFTGKFLSDFVINKSCLFEEWMTLTSEEYNLLAIQGFSLLAIYHERRAEYQQAIEYLARVSALCPWDETIRDRIIRLLGVDHQWAAAKKHYKLLQHYMKIELGGVSPTIDSQNLYKQVCLAAQGKAIIRPEHEPSPFHIPAQRTDFVGRALDLDEIMGWLIDPHWRLVTVTGMGGIGKTRLALALAEKCIGIFRDGVFFVPLLPAAGAAQIVALIAESLAMKFSDQSSNQKQLLDQLRDKEMLIVLDNFEHLLADQQSAEVLDTLLNGTKAVKLLVTSREVLNLLQERVYLLDGLQYPALAANALVDMPRYDAVELFVRCASQKMPQFSLNEKNYQSVVRICHVLEGLPLGVELAAATLCEQGCTEIAEVYEQDLGALTTRMLNFQPRHRSLQAAFEISWNLLDRPLKQVLAGLSIFRDGFSAAAAAQVAEAMPQDLANLIAKSLLRLEDSSRYSMHEVIRQLVRAETDIGNAFWQVEERHAAFYADFLADKKDGLSANGQSEALRATQIEYGNLYLAWHWMVDHSCLDLIEKSMYSLYQYFMIRSLFDDGIAWFKHAADRLAQHSEENLLLGKLLWRLGAMAYTTRDNSISFSSLHQSETILERATANKELAYCRIYLGWAYHREKDFSRAKVYADRSLQYFLEIQDAKGLSETYILIGSIENRQGSYQKSRPYFEKAYDACKTARNAQNLMIAINRLADVLCYEGEYDQARELFNEALQLSRQLNDSYHQAILLNNLGTIDHLLCNYEQAGVNYKESLAITRKLGDLDGVALALNNLGELATWQQDFEQALAYSKEALAIARQVKETWTIIVCLNSLGEIYTGMGRLPEGKSNLIEALKIAVEINSFDLAGRVLVNLGRVYQLLGDRDYAVTLMKAGALHSATEQDSRNKAARWLAEFSEAIPDGFNDDLMNTLIGQAELNAFL